MTLMMRIQTVTPLAGQYWGSFFQGEFGMLGVPLEPSESSGVLDATFEVCCCFSIGTGNDACEG
jgi:hypothetical protein